MRSVSLLPLALLCSGCLYSDRWETVYSAASQDGMTVLAVQESNCEHDCNIRVTVDGGGRQETIAELPDCSVHFAHAAWSGQIVALYASGSLCGPFSAAYDVDMKRSVDFSAVESWLRASIIREYSVTPKELAAYGGDVLKWANHPGPCCGRASDEFRKKYRR